MAIYGLVNCIAVILCGASMGNWIDRTARLTAAKTFLVVQNCSVAVACAVLATFFHWVHQYVVAGAYKFSYKIRVTAELFYDYTDSSINEASTLVEVAC